MTSQCIWGRVNLNVYDTGRELLKMGVVPLENMIAETALVKAMWALGNFTKEELRTIMLSNFEGEFLPVSPLTSRRGYRG
jgi:glutamyl-tRNA(Gln) amidotransferase subunit D